MSCSSAALEAQDEFQPARDERLARAARLAREFKDLADDFIRAREADQFPTAALQDVFSSAVTLYALMTEAGCSAMPMRPAGEASATAIMIAATGLLKSANLELFELGMWQSWSGTR
jgi:hypothetical protein